MTNNAEKLTDESQNKIKQIIKRLSFKDAMKFLFALAMKLIRDVLNISQDADKEGTLEGIKKDISFKGQAVYILACSIFIASIGLNMNSIAVIVGAMLISPLMGPILGVGMAVAINDWEMLLKALRGFAIMVGISLFISWLYFVTIALPGSNEQILSRTSPTLLDVVVAFFGGIAGIIAGSRKEKSNVIPGVAIATALMPPLCVVGYGLANLDAQAFFGAAYLFILNCVFIFLSTLIVVRYMRFPIKQFVNPTREKRVRLYITLFAILVIIPSGFAFWNVIKEASFKNKATLFVKEHMKFQNSKVFPPEFIFTDSLSIIDVSIVGEPVSEERIAILNDMLIAYGLKNSMMHVHQSKAHLEIEQNIDRDNIIDNLIKDNEHLRLTDKQLISDLELKNKALLNEITTIKSDTIPIGHLRKEILALYPNINKISYGRSIDMDNKAVTDTIETFIIGWEKGVNRHTIIQDKKRLSDWLPTRIGSDTVRVLSY